MLVLLLSVAGSGHVPTCWLLLSGIQGITTADDKSRIHQNKPKQGLLLLLFPKGLKLSLGTAGGIEALIVLTLIF